MDLSLELDVLEADLDQKTVDKNHKHETQGKEQDKDIDQLSDLIGQYNQYQQYKDRRQFMLAMVSILLIFGILLAYPLFIFSIDRKNTDTQIESVNIIPVRHNASMSSTISQTQIDKEMSSDGINKKILLDKSNNKQKTEKIQPVKKEHTNIQEKIKNPVNSILHKAYQQYKNKEYESSLKNYQKVLGVEKSNQDAWLGLAANYNRLGKSEQAERAYRELLKLNPQDVYAQAGLLMLAGNSAVSMQEDKFRKLIEKNPDIADLYVGLGRLYMQKNKWWSAQQAYYSAWLLDKSSGNALNLGISLDHQGRVNEALKFYELSLQLNKDKDPEISRLKERIQTLKEQHNEYTGKSN